MDDVFVKLRFLELGKVAPKNSSFKGIIKKNSVFGKRGWFEYTSREGANVERIDEQNDKYYHSFFEYTSRADANVDHRTRDNGGITYTNYGLLSKDNEKKFIEESKLYFKNKGDIVWDTVISFKDFDYAAKHNLKTLEDYGSMMSKILPKFFKDLNIKNENTMWWMNYHSDTDNPHIHLCFLEKEKTRNRGKVEQKYVDKLKVEINKELFQRNMAYTNKKDMYIELLKEKDSTKDILIDKAKQIDFHFFKKIEILFQKIPEKGRLQYNSIHIKPFRKELDDSIEELLQSDDLKSEYDEFLNQLDKIETFGQETEGGLLGDIKELEIKKLNIKLANYLLSCKKYFKYSGLSEQGSEEKERNDMEKYIDELDINEEKHIPKFDDVTKNKIENIIESPKNLNLERVSSKEFLKQNNTFKHNLFQKSKSAIRQKAKELEEEIEKYLNNSMEIWR